MTAFSVDSVAEGLRKALETAGQLDASDAASVTVAVCLAQRIDRLVAEDEPISAALFDSYARALVRLGLASRSAPKSAGVGGRLAALRADHQAIKQSHSTVRSA